MSPLGALLPVWAGVLLVAGLAKLRRPAETALALGGARLSGRFGRGVVRVGAGAEALLGSWSLVAGGTGPAVLVAASYASFTAYAAWGLRRKRPLATCGCLGEPDTPPTWGHLGLCGLAAATSAWCALSGSAPSVASVVGAAGGATPAYLALDIAALYGCILVLGSAPRLLSVRRAPR